MEGSPKNMLQKQKEKTFIDEKGREYFYDNAKYILITLVVMAHFISPLKEERQNVYNAWYVINTFHMPAMIFISGFLAKRYIRDGKFNIQKPFTYILLYTAAQIALSLFEVFILKDDIGFSYFNARSSLWYLQCLILWYLLLPYLDKLKPEYVMVFLTLAGIFIGYDEKVGQFLSIGRAFVHFPFFMLGYYIPKDFVEKLKRRKVVVVLIIVSVLLIIFHVKTQFVPWQIPLGKYSYYDMEDGIVLRYRWIYRIIFYISAIVWGSTARALTPRAKKIFTKYGARTLQVYIIHRFIYLAEMEYEWAAYFDSTLGSVLLAAIAAVMTWILSHKIFEYPFKWIQNIKINRLLK